MSGSTGGATGRFEMAAVLGRSLALLTGRWGLFTVLALIIYSPYFAYVLFIASSSAGVDDPDGGEAVATLLAIFLLQLLMTAACAYAAVRLLRGDRVRVIDCLAVAFDRLLIVIGISLVEALVIGVPYVLLVVVAALISPLLAIIGVSLGLVFAAYVTVGLYAAVPAAVIERTAVLGSLDRSWTLTFGQRWRVFVILLVLLVAAAIVQLIAGAVAALSTVGGLVADAAMVASILAALATALVSTFGAIVACVVYHDLRVAKEGTDTDSMAALFD